MRIRFSFFVRPIIYSFLVLFVWYGLIEVFQIRPYMIPPPNQVIAKIYSHPGLFLYHSSVTLLEAIFGTALGFIGGLILAILMQVSRKVAWLLEPLVVISQTFPKEALAPLFLVWLGFGIFPKVVVAALISFFPVVINTRRGLTAIENEYLALMRTIAAGQWQLFLKLQLPFATPYILASLRMCSTLSVIGAVVGEFVGSNRGLGHLIRSAGAEIATDLIFAALILLAIIGASLYFLMLGIERLFFKKYFLGRDIELATIR